MRDFDTVNEIISSLDDDIYRLTQIGAEEFYSTGNRDTISIAAEKSGLTPEEILWMWEGRILYD